MASAVSEVNSVFVFVCEYSCHNLSSFNLVDHVDKVSRH